ncbi:MAG: glycosyltransferase family 2 protein [Acidimicrobiia bacterium]
MTSTRRPLISIGLPVYNGADQIGDAIRAVLKQTLENIELVVSDNASTDATQEICEDLARADERVRYSRNSSNEGAAANFNKVFRSSRGSFFKWLGHDDFLEPTAMEQALQVLESRPDVSVVHWLERMTDGNGNVLRVYEPSQGFQIDGDTAGARFRQMLLWRHNGFGGDPFFGLMRRQALEATRLQGRGTNPNYLLLQELSLIGKFFTIPEVLAERIYNDVRVTAPTMIRWLDPSGTVGYPHLRKAREYFKVGLRHGEMSTIDRLVTGATLIAYHLHPREIKGFAWDITKGRLQA